tara:strand:+ start:131 stop:880 length:750 start_codon:yes stop_codon:yes gene_type:complete
MTAHHNSIVLENVTLDFPSNRTSFALLKELLISGWNKEKTGYFRAIDNVSLSIKQGEVFGIVGPNGAGKSTILRLIAGIYAPDKGKVKLNGRIILLAGLGAGFQSNLSGRENLRLSGSIYGLSSEEIEDIEQSVIAYSGISQFIDQPIRTYSSGMKARLAFSLASHLEPEILLIDEVLAVGDTSFREKSKNRILNMVRGDTTVVLVSHSQSLLRDVCDRAACFSHGSIKLISQDIDEVIALYDSLSHEN